MCNLKVVGNVVRVKNSVFEGKTIHRVQFMVETEKNGVEILEVKLLENEEIKDTLKGSNVEIDIKLFTSKTDNKIFYTRTNKIKYLK